MDFSALIKTKKAATVSRPLNILFATSEVAPFSNTGMLGDVAQSLPKAMADEGHRVTIVTPMYGHLDPHEHQFGKRLSTIKVKISARKNADVTLWEKRIGSGVTIYFVQHDDLFADDDALVANGDDDAKSAERFAFFSRAVVEIAKDHSIAFDIIHANDWQTALVPVYASREKSLKNSKTVLTIHNAANHGTFTGKTFDTTLLPKKTHFTAATLADGKKLNVLKGGIKAADRVTTVSTGYRDELLKKPTGFGLNTILKKQGDDFVGILNGVDYGVWSPESDPYLEHTFTEEFLNGKRQTKVELQKELGFDERPTNAMIAYVGPLTEEKGVDVLVPALRTALKARKEPVQQFQVVFLGEGDKKMTALVSKLVKDFPKQVAAHFGHDERRAHQYVAASDLLTVPSTFEPCGLIQLYAMRYGSLPVVHATGGLKDTVNDADLDGTGFAYDKNEKKALSDALLRALDCYESHRQFRPMIVRAMREDFSWSRSAKAYVKMYLNMIGNA